jgi:hypothetical protein
MWARGISREASDCDRRPSVICGRVVCIGFQHLERSMPKFIMIGYGDRAGYDHTPVAIRDAAHAHDEHLVAQGAIMGIAGVPVQVRNPEAAGLQTATGPYHRSDLPIAGFGILEADTLEDAVRLASKSPCAVAHGVIEVWPLQYK